MNEVASTDVEQGRVTEMSPNGLAKWDAYVEEAAEGSFYHLSAWKGIIENELHHRCWYLQYERDGQIAGVLPLVQVASRLFGNALISIPFLVYGGPLADDEDANSALVNAALAIARKLKVDYIELRNRSLHNASTSDEAWVTKTNYVTFRKQLSRDPDENLAAIPRKQRAMIRKGIKAGLEAEFDSDTSRLYATLLECKRNLGTPFFGAKYLQSIQDAFQDKVEITTAVHGSQVVCSVMSFRFRNEILPYYGGGGELARTLKGNDFMYWAVMERACEQGVETFDYGRSMAGTGAYRFKKHWGFDEQPLNYQFLMVNGDALPDLNPSNPKYQFLIKCWKQLPLPVAGLVGPRIAKYIG